LYAKGEDGQWHLQQTESEAVKQKTPAIPLPASTPVAGNETSATEHNAASRSAWAEVAPTPEKKIVRKKKTASKNSHVKASTSKKPVKNAAKPGAKGSAKKPTKLTAKAPAKRLIKAAAKPAVKAPAGRLVKAAAKPLTKATATRQSKAAASKPAPVSKRPVSASTPKSAKRVKASKLPVISHAPAFEAQESPREPAPIGQVTELMRES
jgi:hypothetical protein